MFTYIPQTIPRTIFVVGAGGTGSRLMPLLAQFIKTVTRGDGPNGWVEKPTIFLIDDDVIELKNLLRQNFHPSDVGKHKATVLAERYGKAFGVNIIPVLQRVSSDATQIRSFYGLLNQLLVDQNEEQGLPAENGIHERFSTSIVISCVDSVSARRHILNTFSVIGQDSGRQDTAVFIDAGNEDDFGQVKIANFSGILFNEAKHDRTVRDVPDYEVPKMLPFKEELVRLPLDLNSYAAAQEAPGRGSCADLDQTLAINAIMATTIIGMVQNYYYRKPFDYNMVSVSLNGASYTQYNTYLDIKNKARRVSHGGDFEPLSKDVKTPTSELGFLGRIPFSTSLDTYISRIYEKRIALIQKAKEEERKRIQKEAMEARRLREADELRMAKQLTLKERLKAKHAAKVEQDPEEGDENEVNSVEVSRDIPSPDVGIPPLTAVRRVRGETTVTLTPPMEGRIPSAAEVDVRTLSA